MGKSLLLDFFSLGQSGYTVNLVETGGRHLVRKEAAVGDDVGAARLYLQYQKHVSAHRSGLLEPLEIPEIVEPFSDRGYSMAFIPGKPLGKALELMSQREVLNVSESIAKYFTAQLDNRVSELINPKALEKLEQIRSVYSGFSDSSARELGLAIADRLQDFFTSVEIESSPNHGDFSFDNILSDRRGTKLFALDLLDSPFDTVLLDMGRIWLDLKDGWWASRQAPRANSSINMAYLRHDLSKTLFAKGVSRAMLETFSIMAALRVLPYTEQPYRKALLKNAMRRHLEEMR